MFGKKKHKALIWSAIFSSLFTACTSGKIATIEGHEIHGNSQGTTYTIIVAEETLNVS